MTYPTTTFPMPQKWTWIPRPRVAVPSAVMLIAAVIGSLILLGFFGGSDGLILEPLLTPPGIEQRSLPTLYR